MNFAGYYPQYPNNNPYQQLVQMQQPQNPNTFVHVPSEDVARAYTVAPGGSVTFINDNAPYCYTKTAGVNQFDTPIFRKFRLVEETSVEQQKPTQNGQSDSSPKVTPEALSTEINSLRARVQAIEDKFNTPTQSNERRMRNESTKQQKQ